MDPVNPASFAVLPFIAVREVQLGAIAIHPFVVLVATGVVVGYRLAVRRAATLALDVARFRKHAACTLITAFIVSHLFDEVFYHWHHVAMYPIELLMPQRGLSSFGGFLGAAVGGTAYARIHALDVRRSADAMAYAFPVAWQFGRTGCALAHDHPGRASASFIAMHFPSRPELHLAAGSYLDLGLVEWCLNPIVIAITLWVARRTKTPGLVVATVMVAYAVVRFPLDFLRLPAANGGDARWLGLTPAQYGCVVFAAWGLGLMLRAHVQLASDRANRD